MPQERSVAQVITQPLYDVPVRRLEPDLADIIHGSRFEELSEFEDFTDIEKARLISAMVDYIQHSNDRGKSALLTSRISVLVNSLVPSFHRLRGSEPGKAMETLIDDSDYGPRNLETCPEEDLRIYAGFLVEMDRILRQNNLAGPVERTNGIEGFDEEMLKQLFGDAAEGVQNFQSGDRMYADLQDAMLEVRRRVTRVNAVYIPPDFIQLETGYGSGKLPIEDSIFLSNGRRLVNPSLLVRRPVIVPPDQGETQSFKVEDESYWELDKIPIELRNLVHRRQLIELYRRLQVYGDPAEGQAYGRAAGLCLRTEGLSPGSYLPAYGTALHKATELFDVAMAGISGKVLEEMQGKNLLTAKEKAALLMIGRQPLVYSFNREVDAVEIGPGAAMDVYLGNVSPLVRNLDGTIQHINTELLRPHLVSKSSIPVSELSNYENVSRLGFPVIDKNGEPKYIKKTDLDAVINASGQNGMPVIFMDSDYNPFRPGNIIPLQQLFTSSPIKREEEGGGPYLKYIKREMMRRLRLMGMEWKDLAGFPGLSLSGKPLDLNNPSIKNRIGEAGPAAIDPGQDKMLETAIFSSHAFEWGAFQGLLVQLQFLRQADRMLASDNIDEGTIAQAMREQHAQKYQLTLPVMLETLRTYSKQITWFKVELMDPYFVALSARKGMHPSWRNDMNPDKTPEIAPIMYTGDGGGKSIRQKMSELKTKIESFKDALASGQLNEAEKNELNSDQRLLKQLELGSAIIRGSLYSREEWGFSWKMRNNANAIVTSVALAEDPSTSLEQKRILLFDARKIVTENVKYYIENFDQLSPAASYRGVQELLPFLAEVSTIPEFEEAMKLFDFGPFMVSMGLDSGLIGTDTKGIPAFIRAVSVRSVKQLGVAEIDKDGKNTAKYASMAAGYGEAMLKLGPSLNNALNAAIMKLLGEKPERMGGFKPDEIPEALWTQVIEMTMINLRTEKEGAAYVEEIVKAAIEPSQGTGYVSRDQAEEMFLNLLYQIELSSQAIVESNLVFADERSRPGDSKIVGVPTSGLKNLEYDPNSQLCTTLIRRSGFGTNFPDITTGKKPYISMGDYPVNAALVKVESENKVDPISGNNIRVVSAVPVNRKIESLAAFSHRGSIHLAIAALLMYGKDKLLVHKYQTDAFEALMLKHGFEKSVIGKAIKAAKKALNYDQPNE